MLHSLKKMFKSNYLFTFGVIICLFWIIMAIIAPFVAPYDPVVQDLTLRLKAPSAAHIFGTDNFGRDIFSRVIYGGRYSLLAGCLTVVIAGCIGTIYGAIAGYVGGAVDNVMMRLSEMILSFPSLILAMIINAVMGSNLFNTMFALVIVAWPSYARVMRSVVLSVRENEYVTASEALGASRIRILLKEIIPNSITSVLIMATTDIGNQILMFSTLSFLGLGSAPPTPEWGMWYLMVFSTSINSGWQDSLDWQSLQWLWGPTSLVMDFAICWIRNCENSSKIIIDAAKHNILRRPLPIYSS